MSISLILLCNADFLYAGMTVGTAWCEFPCEKFERATLTGFFGSAQRQIIFWHCAKLSLDELAETTRA